MVRRFLTLALLALTVPFGRADPQVINGVDTSRWHGFNLLEKFTLRNNGPYKEDDFRWISELGFTYVRLPIDYRCYTEKEDWLKFREPALAEIDQAVAYGRKYGIHVSINLHRAPGFCINPPAEPKDLWTDPEAEAAFIKHWEMFARRYKGVPASVVSFNLLNEPIRNTRESYVRVHAHAIEAIHAIDPERLVIVDGNNAGHDPAPELLKYANVIQATRGYHPSAISHYQASWVKGSDKWAVPTWPLTRLAGHLYGPSKPELKSALVFRGNFPAGAELALKINLLSGRARLQAKANGKVIADTMVDPKAAPAAWREVATGQKWVYHEPAGDMKFAVPVSAPTKEIAIENIDGDWLQFSTATLRLPDGSVHTWPANSTWGEKQIVHNVSAKGDLLAPAGVSPDQPLIDFLKPWRELSAKGGTVFVGEGGAFNKTPHPVVLAWLESWLRQWQQARYGWALWNFRGAFGVLDSGRTDVTYEDWHGHKLDRQMVDLLQKYAKPAP